MSAAVTEAGVAGKLAKELARELAGIASLDDVQRALHEAIRELNGSISLEALPEMAARLVQYRLSRVPRR